MVAAVTAIAGASERRSGVAGTSSRRRRRAVEAARARSETHSATAMTRSWTTERTAAVRRLRYWAVWT